MKPYRTPEEERARHVRRAGYQYDFDNQKAKSASEFNFSQTIVKKLKALTSLGWKPDISKVWRTTGLRRADKTEQAGVTFGRGAEKKYAGLENAMEGTKKWITKSSTPITSKDQHKC